MKLRTIVALSGIMLAAACGPGENNGENNGTNGGTSNSTSQNNTSGNNTNQNNTAGNNTNQNNTTGNNTNQNNTSGNNTNQNNTTGTNNTNNTTGTNNTNNTNDTSIDAFEQQLWDAICEASFQCETKNTAALITVFTGRFASEADCKNSPYKGDFTFQQTEAALLDGRVGFDAASGQACADAFKDVFCDGARRLDDPSLETACDGLVTPMVAIGGACVQGEECIDGDCDVPDGQCYGSCVAADDPAACGNETCDLSTEYCGMQGPNMACQDRKAAGEDCGEDDECVDGTGCQQSINGGVCTTYNSLGNNEECFESEYCAEGFVCGEVSCQPIAFGGVGDRCSFAGVEACSAGLVCQDFTFDGGVCGPARGDGEDCQFNFQCEIDLYCDGFSFAMPDTPGTCTPRLADGATCDDGGDCASDNCAVPDGEDEGTCEANMLCMLP